MGLWVGVSGLLDVMNGEMDESAKKRVYGIVLVLLRILYRSYF